MGIRAFKLVEIQTKVASMIPFLFGTLYALFRFQQFDGYHFALMLASLLSFDMATTAINNYYDYKKRLKRTGSVTSSTMPLYVITLRSLRSCPSSSYCY